MNGQTTHAVDETHTLAKELAKILTAGNILALSGELGSGKTTFTQGLAKALGIDQRITSPTFLIVKQYRVEKHPSIKTLYHVDLYRIESEADIEGIGLSEMMKDPQGLTVIEWPEKLGKYLPDKRIDIKFKFIDESQREINISK